MLFFNFLWIVISAYAQSQPLENDPLILEQISLYHADQITEYRAANISVFSDEHSAYPPDLKVPDIFNTFVLKLPFAPNLNIKCQQGNNNLHWGGQGASHGPDKALRYSLDLNILGDVSGTPILPAAPGVAFVYGNARPIDEGENGVTDGSAWDNGGLGNIVAIDHGNGVATLYSHLDEIFVISGQIIDDQTPLGIVGRTGGSGGYAHLHFQVHQLSQPIQALAPGFTNDEFNAYYNQTFGVTIPFKMHAYNYSTLLQAWQEKVLDSRLVESDFYSSLLSITPEYNNY